MVYKLCLQVCNQACLSQARINWEGCGSKGIRRKIGGMMEVGALMVRTGWRLAGLSVHSALYLPHAS